MRSNFRLPMFESVEDRLPLQAQKKLERLRHRAEELHSAVLLATDQRNDVAREKTVAEQRLHELTDKAAAMRLGNLPVSADHTSAVQARAAIDRAAASLKAANDRVEARSSRFNGVQAVISEIERWLGSLPPAATLEPFTSKARPAKGEIPSVAIERTRKQIAALQAELHRVRSAPRPAALAKAAIAAEITVLAEAGKPDPFRVIEEGEGIEWPKTPLVARVSGDALSKDGPLTLDAISRTEAPHAVALIAYLFRDALIAKLNAEVDALADDSAALTPEERATKETALLAKLLGCEHDEEAMIEHAEADGFEVLRRREASPLAVLGVAIGSNKQ